MKEILFSDKACLLSARIGYLLAEKMRLDIDREVSEKQPPEDKVRLVVIWKKG